MGEHRTHEEFKKILEDLVNREQDLRQESTENKPGYCPKCFRNYEPPCDAVPLTEYQKSDLFSKYRALKMQQAEDNFRKELLIEKQRKKSKKKRGGSDITEDKFDGKGALETPAEVEQRAERLAEERRQEMEIRHRAVSSSLNRTGFHPGYYKSPKPTT